MADAASTRNRLRKMETGTHEETWGDDLNEDVIDLIDEALDGWTSFTLSGSKTLTSTDYVTNEARARVLSVTSGSGGTVTLPGRQKNYIVRVDSTVTGNVTFTTGSGRAAVVKPSSIVQIVTDATNVDHAYDKTLYDLLVAYADALAFSTQAGDYPALSGNSGKALGVNAAGDSVEWRYSRAPFTLVNSDVTLAIGGNYRVDTSAARALTLPAASTREALGDCIVIVDQTGTAATNNITITRAGSDTIGGDTTSVIDVNRGGVILMAISGGWEVFPLG